jgi:3-deoxy-D-manno-octulosonic-acid transferase
MALVNARLSPRSLRRARRIRWLIEPALASLAAVVAQTPRDAERFRTLGVDGALVAGNLKFDRPVDAALAALGRQWRAGLSGLESGGKSRRPIVLAASTRDGEEADLLVDLNRKMLWVFVPRHPQRFEAVADQITAKGFRLARRSKEADWAQAEVILGDSMGEMAAWYAMADVAILGGSLRPFGGQNLIEAAALGCPVVLGPHTFNFAQAAEDAVECGAALRADNAAQALALAQSVAETPSQRAAMSLSALEWVASHRGATQRTLRALICLLPHGPA